MADDHGGRVPNSRRPAYLPKAAVLAAVYVVTAVFGLRVHAVSAFASLVWAPTGISLAALLRMGFRFWPSIAVGAFAANLINGAPIAVALGIAVGNTLEALAGAYGLTRIPGFRKTLDRLPDLIGLLLIAAVGSSMISATIGVATLLAAGLVQPASFWATWWTWWLGDLTGCLIVAPVLLTWNSEEWRRIWRARRIEAACLGILIVLASLFVFERMQGQGGMAALLSPLLVWAALRFEHAGAARAALLVAGIGVWATTHFRGPFGHGRIEEGLFAAQAFMALNAATFLLLGVMTAERRRAEEKRRHAVARIRQSEERYRSLAEAIEQFLWINDADGRTVYVNPQYEERFGKAEDESGISRWEERIHPGDRALAMEIRNRALAAGTPYRIEYRMRTLAGAYRWMLARVVPVRDDRGSVTSWFGAAADIQDLKAAESELRRAKEEAEAANRAKDQFLATLSHELRTPLTPVLALSSALEHDTALPAEARRRLEIVRRNAELEARLIDDLLDLTRVATGKVQLAPEPLSLAEALGHVLEMFREEAAEKNVVLEAAPTDPEAAVRADPARLRQVLWNIVKNAIKFTPAGGRVDLRTRRLDSGRIAIEVSDTGVGIDPSELARIFRPFEQVGHGSGGLGLGLAISSALVAAHGGTLTAESDGLGRGATFRVELPSPASADLRLTPPESVRRPDLGAARGVAGARGRRVLLVEDHRDTLEATALLLAELSCEVVPTGSIQDAFEEAKRQPFDLVVSDLSLPDGSGLALMRRLREEHGLRGIAVSGYGMDEDLRRSRDAGFVEHLVKPITFSILANAVERFFAEDSTTASPPEVPRGAASGGPD
jgi:PAS domain S-box-containing protein